MTQRRPAVPVAGDAPIGAPDGQPAIADAPMTFDDVYRRERAEMVRLATLLVRSQAVAEELVHDAFLRLYRHFAVVEHPPGFLRTAVVRLCLSWLSRRTGERRRLALLPAPEPVPGPSPDGMGPALDRLSPDHRAAIVLRFYADLSFAEIAQLVGCRETTARTRVHRGLAELRKEIER